MLSAVSKKRLRTLHIKLCRQLGIPPAPHLVFERCYNDSGQERSGKINYYGDGVAVITINPTAKYYRAQRTVAHETYHWYQYQLGILNGTLYKGMPKRYWKMKTTWSKWPWERAAIRFSNKHFPRRD